MCRICKIGKCIASTNEKFIYDCGHEFDQFLDKDKDYCPYCNSKKLEWCASNLWCQDCGEMLFA